MKAAFVTLVTCPTYLVGALVLHLRLLAVDSQYPLVVLVTAQLPIEARAVLEKRGIRTREVEALRPEEGRHYLDYHDRRFADTWTKLRMFELTEFDRVVMLDADMLILKNIDELLELDLPGPDWIAATHACTCNPRRFPHYPADWIPENCAYTPLTHPSCLTRPSGASPYAPQTYHLLNSGLVVCRPSKRLMAEIMLFLRTSPLVPAFRFPDQDLLAAFFAGRWKPLPYIYNALKTLRQIHRPMWRDEEVKCLHYIMNKPWEKRPIIYAYPGEDWESEDLINRWWWDVYGKLERKMKGIRGSGWDVVERFVAQT